MSFEKWSSVAVRSWALAILLSASLMGCGGNDDGGGNQTPIDAAAATGTAPTQSSTASTTESSNASTTESSTEPSATPPAATTGSTTGSSSTTTPGHSTPPTDDNTPAAYATAPTADDSCPSDNATDVPTSSNNNNVVTGTLLTATFSVPMNPVTLNASTFRVRESETGTIVPGTVTLNATHTTATFTPTAHQLTPGTTYNVKITTGAESAAGIALASHFTWSFTTRAVATTGLLPVHLGTAGNYAILAKSGISTVPNSVVTGDIGVSPIARTAITGFSETMDSTNTFSTSTQVTGRIYAADYAPPTPARMTTAISDMETAYTDAAGRTSPDATELGAGEIGGLTLAPGLYKWGTGVSIANDVTLEGGPSDVWIFQIGEGLTQASDTRVILAGGALAHNVFWQVAGGAVIGTSAHFEGVILSQTAINLATAASVNGRLLAQTAVTLQQNGVTEPAH